MEIRKLRYLVIKKENKEEKNNSQIIFALCSLLFIPAINNFLNSFLQIGLSIYLEFLTPLSYIFMAFTSVFFLYKYILKKKIFLGIFIFFVLNVAISYLIYPEIRHVIYTSPVDLVYSPINKLFFFCIPALFGSASITDYKKFFYKMRNWGRISVVMGFTTFYFVFFYVGRSLQYMTYSYFMLLPICVCFEHGIAEKSKLDYILAIAGTLSIFMCGARGAVMSLFLYSVVRMLFEDKRKISISKIIHLFISEAAIVILFLYYKEILSFVVNTLDLIGIDSRFLTYLSQGILLEDSGRSYITAAIVRGVKENPIGYGLYGDRYVTGIYGNGKFRYSHSIFSELLCDFGIFLGSILIIILFWKIIKLLIRLKNNREFNLLLALLPYGLFQLLFSSSFLENAAFFVIAGLVFCVKWDEILKDTRMVRR